MQGLLEVNKRVVVVPVSKINGADVIEAQSLVSFVAGIALNLQRILEHRQRFINLPAVHVLAGQVNQRIADFLFVADLAPPGLRGPE